MKKIKKYIEYFLTKIHVLLEQKKFKYKNTTMKYILKRNLESKDLLVVFSACTRKGIRARYNYVRTLNNITCNKLFILDDFAEDHRGGYYLGDWKNFEEEMASIALINKVKSELDINKLIFCGSSKGGYATLNIGCQYKDSVMIAGGPQYYLATYLIEDESFITLRHIIGKETSDDKVAVVDQHLPERILKNAFVETQKIYLHYSDQEHTYDEHIKYMIDDMKKMNYQVEVDISDYTNHSNISYYFPDFLLASLNKELS